MKLGYTAQPQFRTCQHERDLGVLKRIYLTLGCGTIVQPSEGRDRYSTSVSNITELSTIVIPFFQKYALYGCALRRQQQKGLDFQNFAEGIAIIEKKGHLTQEGFNRLKDLAYSMNTVPFGQKKVLMLMLFYPILLFYIILLFKTEVGEARGSHTSGPFLFLFKFIDVCR